MFANLCSFIRAITCTVLLQSYIVRRERYNGWWHTRRASADLSIFPLVGFDTLKNATQPTRRLAPSRDGEPLSSSSRQGREHALSFPKQCVGTPPAKEIMWAGLYLIKQNQFPAWQEATNK